VAKARVPTHPDASGPAEERAPAADPAADVVGEAMRELSDVPQLPLGLSVTEVAGAGGTAVYAVKGDTFPHRDLLQTLGGRWDGIKRAWMFEGNDPRPAIRERLETERLAHGLSDALPQIDLPNRPHYWGHRQRLRDRFLAGGDNALADYELLEMLLFFAIRRIDTKPVAKDLLTRFDSLAGVVNASADRLGECEHIDHFTITLFKALRIFAARLVREDLTERPALDNWDKLIAYLRAAMAHRMIEQFRLLFLDRRNVLIADEVQHEGSIDHTPVYPREVVKRALALDASALVMVHNHPSNHPQPSKPDIEMTRCVRDALEAVGVALHDHLIISRRGHTSFRQMGLLEAKHR
jgi:DNA repair protein RadC